MKMRLALAALVALLSVPATAEAVTERVVTDPADSGSIRANGCEVTKNRDHSVTVNCPVGHSAVLSWSVIGSTEPHAAISSAQPCRYQPTVRDLGRFHASDHLYRITQRVHHNVVISMEATFGGLTGP